MQIENFNDNLDVALIENKWNHVNIDFGFSFDKCGIHVLKRKVAWRMFNLPIQSFFFKTRIRVITLKRGWINSDNPAETPPCNFCLAVEIFKQDIEVYQLFYRNCQSFLPGCC